jgi:DnaJ-domain-containing protein 1
MNFDDLQSADLQKLAAIAACFIIGFVIVWNFVPTRAKPRPPAEKAWFEILGVTESATDEEIAAAYQRQSGLHHPDTVSHLGPELRIAAEAKTREINAAFETARRRPQG